MYSYKDLVIPPTSKSYPTKNKTPLHRILCEVNVWHQAREPSGLVNERRVAKRRLHAVVRPTLAEPGRLSHALVDDP